MSDNVWFLRGVFGTSNAPVPVPADQAAEISEAIKHGTVLLCNERYLLQITLLDKVDHETSIINVSYNYFGVAYVLYKTNHYHHDAIAIINAITMLDNMYFGKTYIIHKPFRQATQLYSKLSVYDQNSLTKCITCSLANGRESEVLYGHRDSFDLRGVNIKPIDIANAAGKSVLSLYSSNDRTQSRVVTKIMGNCADRRLRTKYICVYATRNLRKINKIKKFMSIFTGNVYVFAIDDVIVPRIPADHINILVDVLFTQEQADIYNSYDAPGEDAIRYDDGDTDREYEHAD